MNTEHFHRIIIFDLDNTLTEAKSPMNEEMARLLGGLLSQRRVGVMSGGTFSQFEKQFLGALSSVSARLENLFLLPTCGASMYRRGGGGWEKLYETLLSAEEKERIRKAFFRAFEEVGFTPPSRTYGDAFEDRGTQITFSALGQKAPLAEKREWDFDKAKRLPVAEALGRHLPEFNARLGGTTSIDVTKKGIDKAYGITQIEKELGIPREQMLYVGDALFPGGNDYPVKRCGVRCKAVKGPEDTKRIIRSFL